MKTTGIPKKNANKGLISKGKSWFSQKLLYWHLKYNQRQMPWKNEKNVYKIWLSEIILQQTRVEQGMPYYKRFIKAFPTIHDLASAKDETVFKFWEGLGYYNRCRNLLQTARFIVKERNGIFPSDYNGILALKGVGPYTAAAIASFAFDLPFAVLDGNVIRVIARVFGLELAADSPEGKKQFGEIAQQLINTKRPGTYNQAIMDFGATVCKPVAPDCDRCPLHSNCFALLKGKVSELPVKGKKTSVGRRWIYYYVIIYNGQVYVRKRTEKDIWRDLFEFVRLDSDKPLTRKELMADRNFKELIGSVPFRIEVISKVYKQLLTHRLVQGRFVIVSIGKPILRKDKYLRVPLSRLTSYAFPKFILSFLEEKNVNLSRYKDRMNELDK